MPGQRQSWIFPYLEDPADAAAHRLGQSAPLRPAVIVRLSDRFPSTRIAALVDSGSERCYAAPGLAREIGVSLDNAVEVEIGLGGETRMAQFVEVGIELFPSVFGGAEPPIATWRAEVGFLETWTPAWPVLLGQKGFFDQFTITMHRSVPALAVEEWEAFDDRFGVQVETVDIRQPRFRP